jgi:hypothetical protein
MIVRQQPIGELSASYWNYTDPTIIAKNRGDFLTYEQEQMLLNHSPGYSYQYKIYSRVIFRIILPILTFDLLLTHFLWPPIIYLSFGLGISYVIGHTVYFGRLTWQLRKEVRRVRIAQGPGVVHETKRGLAAEVSGVRLRTLEENLSLPPGRYSFNYFPRSRILLSAEPVAGKRISETADLEQFILEQL